MTVPHPGSEAGDPSAASPDSSPRLLLAVLGVVVVVTVATTGPDLLPPRVPLEGVWKWTVRIVGAAAAAAGIAGLLAQRRRLTAEGERRPDPAVRGLRTAATLMGVLAVVAILTRPAPPREAAGPDAPAPSMGWTDLGGGGGRESGLPSRSRGGTSPITGSRLDGGTLPSVGPAVTMDGADPGRSPLRQMARSLTPLLIILLIAALAFRALMRRRGVRTTRPIALDEPVAPEAATLGLDSSLACVARAEGAPRGQIAAAYHALLAALTAAGAPREPHEAPHEHLRRALAPLGVRVEPLHRLAALYVMAEFGPSPVTDRHRGEAARALEESLRSLRATRGASAGGRAPAADGSVPVGGRAAS